MLNLAAQRVLKDLSWHAVIRSATTHKGSKHAQSRNEEVQRRGVHLLEWIDLEPLREAGVSEFLFSALPLKIRGATGSWIRPVAVI